MASTTGRIAMRDVMSQLTMRVTVTGLRVWRVRWWCACQLLALSARVAGCHLTVDGAHR